MRCKPPDASLPFTVINPATSQAAGMTTYMNVDVSNRRVEIGSTWYATSVQRSGLNTEAESPSCWRHAFETLTCIAVEYRTHFMTHQSRRAIERLGAKLDGILRSHQVSPNGTLRDTCVYSIIAPEWPTVRGHLEWLLQKATLTKPMAHAERPEPPKAQSATLAPASMSSLLDGQSF